MSKHQIIKKLKEKNPKLNQLETEEILEFFCQCIKNALVNKRNIELRGFGSFLSTEIKEKYSARNPKTGELIYVPKKNKVRFRAESVTKSD